MLCAVTTNNQWGRGRRSASRSRVEIWTDQVQGIHPSKAPAGTFCQSHRNQDDVAYYESLRALIVATPDDELWEFSIMVVRAAELQSNIVHASLFKRVLRKCVDKNEISTWLGFWVTYMGLENSTCLRNNSTVVPGNHKIILIIIGTPTMYWFSNYYQVIHNRLASAVNNFAGNAQAIF